MRKEKREVDLIKATMPQTKVYFSNRKMWKIPQKEYELARGVDK